ncbi:uncharacterized protein BJ212DRAFT_1300676 [Suillus subaureus]|uniref:Uncharacterized protein n=1 Tax=Suillus subaureus TaxID=48587 RepID=A0A9P7E960_9AGAM|nr:uncharacterized protein BJ212DRAFT_1300676 [Suillus subaureus]KAG1814381.1 hypothetical protein BJ212DRAFT_1300676 [Suillus subaureus]
MSNSSTVSVYDLSHFTTLDAANVLEFATSHFATIWLICNQNYVPHTPAYKASFIQHIQWEADCFVFPFINIIIGCFICFQTGTITTDVFHDKFFAHCSLSNPTLGSTHQLMLGFELLLLDLQEVMEMTRDHFEQLPMGTMLLPGPVITDQADGDALVNQIVVVRAHLQQLSDALSCLLEEKTQVATVAAATMARLEALMDELLDSLCQHQSVLPPLELDVPTMLACQQLVWVLADAYTNLIQLDLDMICYNEALDRHSTGQIAKHEEALLQKFPHPSQQLLDKPLVLVDSGSCIILWYLPEAINHWIQANMDSATVSMSFLLKRSTSSGTETNWRTCSNYFHVSNRPPLTLGCINVAPCWFQQGQEVRPLASAELPILT